jgi:hypothetical protein
MYNASKSAYIWTRVLDTPFWGLFNLIPFIIYKDLNASPFELALLVTIKPIVSILSSYFSTQIKQHNLGISMILARIVAYCPFFFIPFFHPVWYIIASVGLFMFLQVGTMPAWMELLKKNLPSNTRDKVVSYCQAFGYLGGGLLPFALGWILDEWQSAWMWMFPFGASIGLLSSFWQKEIPKQHVQLEETSKKHLLHPFRSAFKLLKQRRDFAHFQMGFMLLGSALMMIQPTLPVFFVDELHLSYMEVGVAITLCKGIGYAFSSPLWVKWIRKVNLFIVGATVSFLSMLFALFLLGARLEIAWLYVAYVLYGLMQAGSELSWNLSGPIFAKNQDSAPFSNVNILAVGLRGIFIPTLGAFFLAALGSPSVIILSGAISLLALVHMLTCKSKTLVFDR